MQAIEKKISKLEEQKAKLEKEIAELQKKKNEEFLSLLNKIPSLNLEPIMLVGGLLHVIEEAQKKPELKERWLLAAQKFCGRSSSQKRAKAAQSPLQKGA
jgi:restriction endonuclease S subunit